MGRQPIYKLIERAFGRRCPDSLKTLVDIGLMTVAALWAWFLAFGQVPHPGRPWHFVLAVLFARLPLYGLFGLHRVSWRSVSRFDVMRIAATAALGMPLIWALGEFMAGPPVFGALRRPLLLFPGEAAFYALSLCAVRITARALQGTVRASGGKRTLIVGSGEVGRALASQLLESPGDYALVGFVDDSRHAQGRRIRGLPVLGTLADLPTVIQSCDAHQVVVAIPSLPADTLRGILQACEARGVPARIVPPLQELMGRTPTSASLRPVRMEDLLPRPEVTLDREAIGRYLRGRTVLVTGGGGSIGGELCRQVLHAGAGRLLVLGRGENSVFEICQELSEFDSDCEIVPVITDVRDREALASVFAEFAPEVVFHAAAHKHVPLMEMYPAEAVKNNVLGTLHLVQLSVQHGVRRFVMISTDKAVSPSSVMGATKRIGELIVKAYAAAHDANFVSVRFGNVLGSRGSVVRVMQRQIERRLPVTVTDPEMVRYFMTIPEAVQLVLQAGAAGGKGEVFVLEMGHPVRILDLARDLIRLSGLVPDQDIPIRIIGRRPGEKVREELFSQKEASRAEQNGQFRIAPLKDVPLSSLLAEVESLGAAAGNGGAKDVPRLLQRLVPDFAMEGAPPPNGNGNGTAHDAALPGGLPELPSVGSLRVVAAPEA